MINEQKTTICIIGIGNTLRSDDGIGALVCTELDKLSLPGVTTMAVHQLDLSLLEDLLSYEHILFVDAALNGTETKLYPLEAAETPAIASSHHVNATMLGSLAHKVYGRKLSLFLCEIPGENFDLGNEISSTAAAHAAEAIRLIKDWIYSLSN